MNYDDIMKQYNKTFKVFNSLKVCTFAMTVLLMILLLNLKLSAQNPDTIHSKVSFNKHYFKSFAKDGRDLLISPSKWDNKDLIIFSTTCVALGGLFTQDAKIQEFSQTLRTPTLDSISKYGFEPWGGYYSLSTMALFYLHGTIFKNERSKRVSMLGVKTFLLSGILVNFPKRILNRSRPYHGDYPDPMVWNGPIPPDFEKETLKYFYKSSFFSGHTTSIFSVATIVASEYRDKPIVPIICYSLASLAGISRIYDNKHWASDIVGGAIFGYAIGKLIYNENNWKINIVPFKNEKKQGLTLVYNLK
jgi:membrane-associated phospholipid phosphatase